MNRIVNTLPKLKRSVLAPLLSLSLLACQAPPQTGPAPASTQPASANAAKVVKQAAPAAKAAPPSLSARLERSGQRDRIVFRLPPELFQRQGFRAQAFANPNLAPLRFLRIFVTGPGIASPIESDAGTIDLNLDTIPASISLADVPRGPNRVIVAQFYDADMNPLAYAAPMGVYSSGDDTANIQIRRQYSLLGRVIMSLLEQNQGALAIALDTAALQAQIDQSIYFTVPPADPNDYALDPTFIDGAALASEIVTQGGNFSAINIGSTSFAIEKSSLTLQVDRLVSSGNLTIRVSAPFVAGSVVTGNKVETLTNIPPGNWHVTLISNGYDYPNASLDGTPLSFVDTGNGMPQVDLGVFSFAPGATLDLGQLALRPELSVNALTINASRTGQSLNISGAGLNPVASTNTVSFSKADAVPVTTNASSFAGSGETAFSVTVPALPEPGVYSVSVNGQSAGNLRMNTWMVSPTGAGTGFDWSSPSSLSNALANSNPDDVIWLKGGTYTPHASDRAASFAISRNLSLLGGFDGTASDGSRDPDLYPVTLSGDLAGNDVPQTPSDADADRQDNSHHVLQISSSASLDGLTISGGHAYDAVTPPADQSGGGILFSGSGNRLSLNEVILTQNHAADYGGGLAAGQDTVLEISDSSFSNNSAAAQYGGGLYGFGAASTISGSYFHRNLSLRGGGAAFENGSLSLSDTRFVDNDSTGSGGGLFVNFMSGSFERCDFVNNQAAGSGGGAEIMDFGGSMDHSLFSGNTAAGNGGGLYQHTPSSSNDLDLLNTGFQGNAAVLGGGIYFDDSSSELTSSVFGSNSADQGGGIYLSNGSAPVLRHCTIAANSATTGGRQISFVADTAPVIANSVIWTGPGTGAEIADSSTGAALIQNSIVTGLAGLTLDGLSSNNLDQDPLLVNPALPSGLDGDFGSDDDGFRLTIGSSPAINMGLELLVSPDIRGKLRSGAPDAGAYEAVP